LEHLAETPVMFNWKVRAKRPKRLSRSLMWTGLKFALASLRPFHQRLRARRGFSGSPGLRFLKKVHGLFQRGALR
jgi:hypothetical protein